MQESKLKEDINIITKINSSIGKYKNEIIDKCEKGEVSFCNESVSTETDHYTVAYEFEKSDTTIAIEYRCREYNKQKYYGNCTVTKQYNEENLRHEACLFNGDTLYHYTTVLSDKAPLFFIDYHFYIGKYYYIFMCNSSMLSESQYIYFMQHVDSLINVRGNTLPELPGTDTVSLQEFRASGEMLEIFDANPFLQNCGNASN